MEMTLIIIILLLIGVFNLITLAVLGALLIKMYSPSVKLSKLTQVNNSTTQSSTAPPPIDETIKRKQKEYEEQLVALNDLMNYSADVAYGVKRMDD